MRAGRRRDEDGLGDQAGGREDEEQSEVDERRQPDREQGGSGQFGERQSVLRFLQWLFPWRSLSQVVSFVVWFTS